jgi:hypothetical protein
MLSSHLKLHSMDAVVRRQVNAMARQWRSRHDPKGSFSQYSLSLHRP